MVAELVRLAASEAVDAAFVNIEHDLSTALELLATLKSPNLCRYFVEDVAECKLRKVEQRLFDRCCIFDCRFFYRQAAHLLVRNDLSMFMHDARTGVEATIEEQEAIQGFAGHEGGAQIFIVEAISLGLELLRDYDNVALSDIVLVEDEVMRPTQLSYPRAVFERWEEWILHLLSERVFRRLRLVLEYL